MPVRSSFKSVVGNYEFPVDRFNMLDNVLELPCRNILQDPKFTLTNLDIGGRIDSIPPQTFYRYEFTDEYDCTFKT